MLSKTEAHLQNPQNLIILLSDFAAQKIPVNVWGQVISLNDLAADHDFQYKIVYLCGDIRLAQKLNLKTAQQVCIVRDFSSHWEAGSYPLIDSGQIPLSIHGLGIYFRRFFNSQNNYFQKISQEHRFQSLTESTKPGTAHRTGIYLCPVTLTGDELHFHLLRCSTNLAGPTDAFAATDFQILNALNHEASQIFENAATMNHVLAQIYHQKAASPTQKETKARISAHADKTKDMPVNGIMAFCTFYDQLDKLQTLQNDPFDYGYKEISGLTQLKFRIKAPLEGYPDEFSLTLYPNSVFFMPLSTNRLYTHEIKPSKLNADLLPIRMGYVVRCSKTSAVHTQGQTYIQNGQSRIKLAPAKPEGIKALRHLYAQENKTQDIIEYGNQFDFSMNQGDYLAPRLAITECFRDYKIELAPDLSDPFWDSVEFEHLGKGRKGTVLVNPDASGRIPIVRTTSLYKKPAQCFKAMHLKIAKQIQKIAGIPIAFNNALIEMYTSDYSKMGSHSDQALDLADHSYIALFSCYRFPDQENARRKLVIESKDNTDHVFEIQLKHHQVLVFSLETNRHYRHKIVLEDTGNQSDNPWLGMTFRSSKTWIHFQDQQAFFEDQQAFTLANEEQKKEFIHLRRLENQTSTLLYPELTYTLSASDLVLPTDFEVIEESI